MLLSPSIVASTKLLLWSVAITSSPSTIRAQSDVQVSGFTYVGEGQCSDKDGTLFDFYGTSQNNPSDCAAGCKQLKSEKLVGFFFDTRNICYCNFDDGFVTEDQPKPAGYSSMNHWNNGNGVVQGTSVYPGLTLYCYKYDAFVSPAPTFSPTNAATHKPSSWPSISPSDMPSFQPTKSTISKYSNIDTEFGFDDATLTADGSSSFQFNFTNSIPASTIHAAIIADSACSDTNSNYQVKEGVTTSTIGPVVVDASVATITKEFASEVDVADKNNGSVTLQYCLRADLYDDSDSKISISAKKVNLQLGITYETESDFAITNIQTSEFVASSTTASATRSVGIKVFKDSCSSGCEIVEGDASGCFAGTDNAVIGDVLTLCLDAEDDDVDLTGIESAKIDAADYTSDIVQFKENGSAGTDNFVTTTAVANGQVTLETLLLPAYYDALDGGADGSLEVSGTVLLTYVESAGRRLARELQDGDQVQDETPFSLNIPVENPSEIPEIVQGDVESSTAASTVVVIMGTMVVAAAGGLMANLFW